LIGGLLPDPAGGLAPAGSETEGGTIQNEQPVLFDIHFRKKWFVISNHVGGQVCWR